MISFLIRLDRHGIDFPLSLSFSREMKVNYLNEEVKVRMKTIGK